MTTNPEKSKMPAGKSKKCWGDVTQDEQDRITNRAASTKPACWPEPHVYTTAPVPCIAARHTAQEGQENKGVHGTVAIHLPLTSSIAPLLKHLSA